MPKFVPKTKKEEGKKKPTVPPEEKPAPEPTDEEREKLRELERKFSAKSEKKPGKEPEKKKQEEAKPKPTGKETIWEKIKRPQEQESDKKAHERIAEHDARRRAGVVAEGMIGPGHPEYISEEKLEKRRRELAMTEARLHSLEREEQDINKRLDYLRKEHSAMEMAIKEKTYLEREIAELREDRDLIKAKLDELKEMEGKLEDKTWDELKRSPAVGSRISALERRIHELEGQILDLKEKLYKSGVTEADLQETPSQPKKPAPEPEPRPQPKEEKPEEKPKPEPKPEEKPAPKKEKKEPESEAQKTKKTRLTF
jgi:hypothetical protein